MNWFFSAGDLEFLWKEQIDAMSWLPQVFRADIEANTLFSLWLDYPFRLVVKVLSFFGFSWFVIEKMLWVSVFVLAFYASYQLTKHWLTPIIYTCNTYFLLLFSGGQLGVAFAYAFAPIVFHRFMQKSNSWTINGLLLALLIVFDLRIAFIVLLATFWWWRRSLLSLIVALSVHLYWIVPTVFASHGVADLDKQFTNLGMLKFLSFADFSHAISLLHPNWPENLFGRLYFLQPEFLVIPVVAFSALLWKPKKYAYFALLAVIGAFLAKGVNDPFGGLFRWLFEHVPGFVMFRDPTKFYLYVALGYAVLIPAVLKKNRYAVVAFGLFWLFTLRGMHVQVSAVPEEYEKIKNMLVADTTPSRVLWIPQKEKFAFSSSSHPVKVATNASALDASVKYVIVPIDVNRRIFLSDYTYDPALRTKTIEDIRLPRDERFRDVAVFVNPDFSDMKAMVSPTVAKQQQFAIVGLIMSIVMLLFWLLWIFLH